MISASPYKSYEALFSTFLAENTYVSVLDLSESRDLSKFLAAILDTESIEELNLDFMSLWDRESSEHQQSFALGPIINPRTWKSLRSLDCTGLHLHLTELEQFLNNCTLWKGPKPDVEMYETYLLSGTWAKYLDFISEKAASVIVNDPCGAECDDMEIKEVEEIFGRYYTYNRTSKAIQYACGGQLQNPLRKSPLEMSTEESSEESS